jgi:hypothetical protein
MKDVTVHTGLGGTWLTVHPTNSDNRSANWLRNHFPLKTFTRHLVAARMRYGLSMDEIKSIGGQIKRGEYSLHAWGTPGSIQVFF